ncbi:MAG: aspartyl/glutamyl-tRNA amidotransferase subunit C [Planctomycetes bacterium]|nr:aspartyl/glutamyl-tRNA amidotransferase subunit C [Planctomycetota bacterium]
MPAPAIDRTELKTLCELARLHLPAEREDEVLSHLQRIVSAFAALRSVDASEEGRVARAPLAEPVLRPRDDEPGPVLEVEAALGNAPEQVASMFLVPRVVDA